MKFNKLFEQYLNEAEVESMGMDPELAPETGPQEAFKSLEDALGKFYALGQKGLGADAAAVHDRVYNILLQHEVDKRDMQRFSDVLTSIILGQSVRGFADSR